MIGNMDIFAIMATASEDGDCLRLNHCRLYYPGFLDSPSHWVIPDSGAGRPFPDFASAADFAASYERVCQYG